MPLITPSLLAGLPQNGPTDPIAYYRKPVVGWLFRERINRGLRLLPERRFASALEVGYAAGAVLLALADAVDHLHGIDLDADPAPVDKLLRARGAKAELIRGSVLDLPYPDGKFDLVVCFSVFEHLDRHRRALDDVTRVLAPRGLFLLGMPAVNRMMEFGFAAIGFRDVNHHHITTPADVSAQFSEVGLRVIRTAHFEVPRPSPFGVRIYNNWLLEKGS